MKNNIEIYLPNRPLKILKEKFKFSPKNELKYVFMERKVEKIYAWSVYNKMDLF